MVNIPLVPASNVGGETADLLRGSRGLVGLGQLLRSGLEVGVPAEPAAVARVDVHDDVGKVEVLEGVGDAVAVAGRGVLAGLQVRVGDEVGKRVGLDDEREGDLGVRLEDLDDGCFDGSGLLAPFLSFWDTMGRAGHQTKKDSPSIYSVLYRLSSPAFNSPLEALAAQSRPGKS